MDVKTVCLGMLSDKEASGYDLKKQFESSFGHFFAAGFGSIYPALSALAKDGLVSFIEVPQEGRPNRKVYRITDQGHEHLLKALDDPSPSHKVRSEFLAMMCFAHLMRPQQVEAVLDNRVKETARYLEMFDQFETSCMEDWPQGMKFVLGFGKAVMRTITQYIDENRHMLLEEDKSEHRSATA